MISRITKRGYARSASRRVFQLRLGLRPQPRSRIPPAAALPPFPERGYARSASRRVYPCLPVCARCIIISS